MPTVLVQNQQNKLKVPLKALIQMTEKVLEHLNLADCELSVVLCEGPFIAELNERYLDRKGPTNVMSFPLDEGEADEQGRLLGDVVINVERAIADADDADASPILELAFLLIHGICHLAGFDHEGENANFAPEMEQMEDNLHSLFGNIILGENS